MTVQLTVTEDTRHPKLYQNRIKVLLPPILMVLASQMSLIMAIHKITANKPSCEKVILCKNIVCTK